jgi:2-polyprenyl-3-methyl-5-hydroxy-6-metoxy-1,4-benzoquinol methylase/heme/copper-type cytochrome/quinol oxidase subunit 4
MDYGKQQQFLRGSRLSGLLVVAALLLVATLAFRLSADESAPMLAMSAMAVLALAVSIYYVPDYLHLTVNPEKRKRWIIKIRWRIVVAVLVLGCLAVSTMNQRAMIAVAAVWIAAINLLAKHVPDRYLWIYFLAGDLAALAPLLFSPAASLWMGAVLLAAALHLAIVISGENIPVRAGFALAVAGAVFFTAMHRHGSGVQQEAVFACLLLFSAAGTLLLVWRAESHNAENIECAMRELVSFKGYTEDKIRHLWAVSNQELARNWKQANLRESDKEGMAEWYRQNSELYLFAISGYNLDYKRIRSTFHVIALARGACLDYGAGNGEVLLELARRGHRVGYYDVEGETMRFAKHRASQHNLPLQFFHSKSELAAAAAKEGFDTVFSLDVLEHIPDLSGELQYLASLLNAGGLFVFDVPAGATKAHPMHLNHNVDVVELLRGKGLTDERTLWQKLPFRKEEKYFFRA